MSKWQEIPSGRMGFGYEQAHDAGVPWALINYKRPLRKIKAEQAARKKAAQDAAERARNWSAAPRLLKKAQLVADARARAQVEQTRTFPQASSTGRTSLTAAEIDRRRQALKRNRP